jgi:hypothetical protein
MSQDNLFLKKLTDEDVGVRDALHIAVIVAKVREPVWPGDHVGIKKIDGTYYVSYSFRPHVAVVNPFEKDKKYDDTCLLCLYPGSISSLRHAWEHDSFDHDSYSKKLEKRYEDSHIGWITKWAACYGMDFDEVVEYGKRYVEYGDYVNHGPRFDGESVPDEFWTHYNELDGIKGTKYENKDGGGSFFTCSC